MKRNALILLCVCISFFANSVLIAQEDFDNPIEIGNISITADCESITYYYSENTCLFDNDVAGESKDVVYRFTLTAATTISLNLCDSDYDTYLYLFNSELNEVSYNDDSDVCDGFGSYLIENLIAGTYYVVCEGYDNDCGQYNLEINASRDEQAPVLDLPALPDLTGACFVDFPEAPTATDICDGSIVGYTNAEFPIYETSVITWTFSDNVGHVITQDQNVFIDDNELPVPDNSLDDLSDECMVFPELPTATDNCLGTIYGTADVMLPITAQGTTVITWFFVDGNENVATQTQNVTITDLTAPVPNVADLPDLTGCSSFTVLPVPTATDFCAGVIEGVTDAILPITESTTITWTFDDGKANISTQTQNVIVGSDNMPPFPDADYLEEVFGCNSISDIEAPTATDACEGVIFGTTEASFPIEETTEIVWSFDDGNGNVSTQLQNVLVVSIDNTISNNSPVLTANMNAESYQWIDCDNENSPIDGENSQSFTATVSGSYSVMIYYNECMAMSECIDVNITDVENSIGSKEISIYPNPVSGMLNISMPESGESVWTITSIAGMNIANGKSIEQDFNIILEKYAPGIYFLNIKQAENFYNLKFVKE